MNDTEVTKMEDLLKSNQTFIRKMIDFVKDLWENTSTGKLVPIWSNREVQWLQLGQELAKKSSFTLSSQLMPGFLCAACSKLIVFL